MGECLRLCIFLSIFVFLVFDFVFFIFMCWWWLSTPNEDIVIFRCEGGVISPFLLVLWTFFIFMQIFVNIFHHPFYFIFVNIFHFCVNFSFFFLIFCIIFPFFLHLGELCTILIGFDSLYLSYRLVYNYVVHDRSFSQVNHSHPNSNPNSSLYMCNPVLIYTIIIILGP